MDDEKPCHRLRLFCRPPGGAKASATIGPVTFDYNSFSVRSTDPAADASNLAALQAVGQALAANPAARVVLHGFSDGKGKPEYNLKLSRKRAKAVAQFLVTTYGIPTFQIGIVAHGSSQASQGVRQRHRKDSAAEWKLRSHSSLQASAKPGSATAMPYRDELVRGSAVQNDLDLHFLTAVPLALPRK